MKKALLLVAVLGYGLAHAGVTARSYSRPIYSSKPSYTYRAPSNLNANRITTPQISRPVVVQKNVTVHQNVTHVSSAPASSGGGWFSSFFGSFAGAGLSNWFFGHKEQQPQVVQQTVDCTLPQNKQLQICLPAK